MDARNFVAFCHRGWKLKIPSGGHES
jgi:hypothetical protein